MAKQIYLPDILQDTDYDCGVECVRTIMAYYGIDYTDYKLEKMLHVSRKWGTGTKSIVDFFKSRDFKVKSGSFKIEDLIRLINKKIPVIILIQAWATEKVDYRHTNNWGHYVVVCGYNKRGLIIEDPAIFGRAFISYCQLNNRWHAVDIVLLRNFGIAVWGKKPYDYNKYEKLK